MGGFNVPMIGSIVIATTSPGFRKLRRIETDAHARARAGRDEIAGLERHHARQRFDQRRNVEYELAHVRVLPHFAVHFREQPQLRDVLDLVRGDDARPHRAVAVEAFAQEPLLVAVLQRARGRIVDDRVAVDVIVRALFWLMLRPPSPMTTVSSPS